MAADGRDLVRSIAKTAGLIMRQQLSALNSADKVAFLEALSAQIDLALDSARDEIFIEQQNTRSLTK